MHAKIGNGNDLEDGAMVFGRNHIPSRTRWFEKNCEECSSIISN